MLFYHFLGTTYSIIFGTVEDFVLHECLPFTDRHYATLSWAFFCFSGYLPFIFPGFHDFILPHAGESLCSTLICHSFSLLTFFPVGSCLFSWLHYHVNLYSVHHPSIGLHPKPISLPLEGPMLSYMPNILSLLNVIIVAHIERAHIPYQLLCLTYSFIHLASIYWVSCWCQIVL